MVPGRKFSVTTSHLATMRFTRSMALGSFRFRVMLFLLRFRLMK